jgi:hypothetical protein
VTSAEYFEEAREADDPKVKAGLYALGDIEQEQEVTRPRFARALKAMEALPGESDLGRRAQLGRQVRCSGLLGG